MATLVITNPDGSLGLTGWTLDPVSTPGTYAVDSGAAGLVASPSGTTTSFFSNGANFVQMYQIIPLTAPQITQVQSGRSYVDITFVAGTYTDYNKAGLTITPMDATNTELHTISTGDTKNQSARSAISGVWTPRGLRSYLPPSTTQVKIAIFSKPYYTFTNDGYITDIIVNLSEDLVGQEMFSPTGVSQWATSSGILSPDNATLYPNVVGSPADNFSDPWDCGMHRGGLFFPPAALVSPITASQGLKISINYDNLFNAIPTNYDPNYLSVDIDCYDAVGNYLGTTVTEEELITPYGPAVTANRLLQTPTGAVKGIIRVTGNVRAHGEFGFRFNSFAISIYNVPGVDANDYQFADKLTAKTYVKSFPVQANPNSVFDALNFENTVFQSWNPTFVSSATFTSCEMKSFTLDYFGPVYVTPLEYDYGYIDSDNTLTYTVWNSNIYANVNISSMAFDTVDGGQSQTANGGGVTFPAYAFPLPIKPQQYYTYTVTAESIGPIELKAKLDLNLTIPAIDEIGFAPNTQDQKSIALKGKRGLIVPLSHNWSSSYTLSYNFKTEIIKSWSGKEQRRAARHDPRVELETSGFSTNSEIHDMLESWQDVLIAPQCVDGIPFTRNADGTINILDNKPWLDLGVNVFMGVNCCSKMPITSISSIVVDNVLGTITVQVNAPVTVQNGVLYKALAGRVDGTSSSFHTSMVSDTSFTLKVLPEYQPTQPKALPSLLVNDLQQLTGVMYGAYQVRAMDGMEIFDLQPDWSSKIDLSYKTIRNDVDFNRGVITYNKTSKPSVVYKYSYLTTDASYVTDFFKRMKGRRGTFLHSTQIRDMEILPGLGYSDFKVADPVIFNQLGQPYGVSFLVNDTWEHFKILSIVGDTINIYGALTLEQLTPRKVSWLYKSRLETDKLSLNYKTDRLVEFNLAVKIL